jgi:hypothetical protein
MTIRRRFTADFKARVALDALRGDKTNLIRYHHCPSVGGLEIGQSRVFEAPLRPALAKPSHSAPDIPASITV